VGKWKKLKPVVGNIVKQVAIAQLTNAWSLHAHWLSARKQEGSATRYAEHTQGYDERRYMQTGDYNTLTMPATMPAIRPPRIPARIMIAKGIEEGIWVMIIGGGDGGRPITYPVERSTPPEMMTKVCPRAMSMIKAISVPMLWKLKRSKKPGPAMEKEEHD